MEPTNRPPVKPAKPGKAVVEFLPDADEMERKPLPAYAQTTVYVMAGALFSFLLWASVSTIDTVIIARGRLVNPMPNIVVQPLESAVIEKINVRIGQIVRKGEVLATLDPTFSQADEAALRVRMQSLDTQIQNLEDEMGGSVAGERMAGGDTALQARLAVERQASFTAQQNKLAENLARIAASQQSNLREQKSLGTRLAALKEIEAMQEKLVAQQYGARLQLLEARNRTQEVERELELANSRETELAREYASARAEKQAFEKGTRQKTMEEMLIATRERNALSEELNKADKRRQLVTLVAPQDAVVLEMAKLSEGSVIKSAEAMFTLVPLGAPLEAEVQIDSQDVGYVRTGLPAHIKLDAFPFQKHGSLDAKVRTVSEDAFRRESAQGGLDAYYMSRVAFGTANLKAMDGKSRLLPGMTVAAEIVVGKRTVISYLIWPLTKSMNESIREP